MFFRFKGHGNTSKDFLKTDMYLTACYIVQNYPIRSSEQSLELYIKQNYRMSLKDMCLNLLTQLTINETEDAELVLIFNDPELDAIARIITYGNGVVPGSRILQIALNQQ